jgi:hypothetical protein
LNPDETPGIDVNIGYEMKGDLLHIQAQGENETDVYFKLTSTYQFI